MGFFNFGKREDVSRIQVSDDAIVAIADGEVIDVSTVSDPAFAQQMMGQSLAFRFNQDTLTLCAPANGTLAVLFPTGHSYGIVRPDGVEILIHVGIDTVNAQGQGFQTLAHQGDEVKAGDPIVKVDFKKLRKEYDMSTILIITNPNGHTFQFIAPQQVKRGQSLLI